MSFAFGGIDLIDRVVVINDFVGGGGGAAELAVASAVGLTSRGVPVTFITGEKTPDSRLVEAGIPVIGCGQAGLLASPFRNVFRGLYNDSAARVVREWIVSHDTPGTAYHLHNWSQIFSPAIFSVLASVADRLVMTAHDFFLVCPNGGFADYQRNTACFLKPMSLACVGRNCDRRSYGHKLWRVARQSLVDHFRQTFVSNSRITVLHPAMIPYLAKGGIPVRNIRVLRNPVRAFSTKRIEAERNRKFFFIGRLHEGKGADLFLEAAHVAGVKPVLIGDGPQRGELERRFPFATFTGWKTPSEVSTLAADMRAVVVPSRYPEPFGLIALEAAWSGVPPVISSTAMLSREIETAGAGVAVDPFDTPSFARVLKRLADSDEDVRSLSLNGFEKTASLGTHPHEWIDRLLEIYVEILGDEVSTRTAHSVTGT